MTNKILISKTETYMYQMVFKSLKQRQMIVSIHVVLGSQGFRFVCLNVDLCDFNTDVNVDLRGLRRTRICRPTGV